MSLNINGPRDVHYGEFHAANVDCDIPAPRRTFKWWHALPAGAVGLYVVVKLHGGDTGFIGPFASGGVLLYFLQGIKHLCEVRRATHWEAREVGKWE